MSTSETGGGPIGRREVAVRCFAAEYDDASLEYSESDEDRAPNYVVTPTGARINRLFVVGVLTEVESVSDDVLRGRVVDPTGAFVVYAGQYQPDAKTALERAEPPAFVAVTGKARTFEPDDGGRVYTSIRPESINVVDPATRDRWTVQAARQTIERVATFAAALEREERGAALTEALVESGVDPALASGIPRAIDHYGTTEAYLAAVRELALQAAGVVAGEREEVDSLDLPPDEGGTVEADLTDGVSIESSAATAAGQPAAGTSTDSPTSSGGTEPGTAGATGPAEPEPESTEPGESAVGSEADPVGSETTAVGDAGAPEVAESGDDDLGDFDDFGADEETVETAGEASAGDGAAGADDDTPGDDDLYEMDEEERAAVEAEFGTDFSTGNEVDEPGEADIGTSGPADEADAAPTAGAGEAPDDDAASTDASATGAEAAADASGTEADDADEVDLVDAAVAAMEELDEGDGAERGAVIETVAADRGADEDAVEDAVREALMEGRCYEPDDDHVKAI